MNDALRLLLVVLLLLLRAAPAWAQDTRRGAGGVGGRRDELGCPEGDDACVRRALLEQIERTIAALKRAEAAQPREVRLIGLSTLAGAYSLPRQSEAAHGLALTSMIAIDASDPRRHLTVRGRGLGRYGDGTASLIFHHHFDFTVGYLFNLDERRGVALRGGWRYQFRGDSGLLSSMVALPEAQLGYDWRPSGGKKVELGVRGAPVLVGRYKVGDDGARKLGQELSWGGHATLWLGAVNVEVDWTRVQPWRSPTLGPLDQVSAWVCGRGVPLGFKLRPREAHLSLCVEGRLWQGELRQRGAPTDASASQVSLVIGVE